MAGDICLISMLNTFNKMQERLNGDMNYTAVSRCVCKKCTCKRWSNLLVCRRPKPLQITRANLQLWYSMCNLPDVCDLIVVVRLRLCTALLRYDTRSYMSLLPADIVIYNNIIYNYINERRAGATTARRMPAKGAQDVVLPAILCARDHAD